MLIFLVRLDKLSAMSINICVISVENLRSLFTWKICCIVFGINCHSLEMEDGEDRYARDREEGRDDQNHDADDLIYEEDENELDNNEQPVADDNDDNNDAVEQDAGADDNDADNHRRGRNQRITETVPDKDVNNLYITNLSFQVL